MTQVSAISAYSRPETITPVRANADYQSQINIRQPEPARQPQTSSFGAATTVTLSPQAQAIVDQNQRQPEKSQRVGLFPSS